MTLAGSLIERRAKARGMSDDAVYNVLEDALANKHKRYRVTFRDRYYKDFVTLGNAKIIDRWRAEWHYLIISFPDYSIEMLRRFACYECKNDLTIHYPDLIFIIEE